MRDFFRTFAAAKVFEHISYEKTTAIDTLPAGNLSECMERKY